MAAIFTMKFIIVVSDDGGTFVFPFWATSYTTFLKSHPFLIFLLNVRSTRSSRADSLFCLADKAGSLLYGGGNPSRYELSVYSSVLVTLGLPSLFLLQTLSYDSRWQTFNLLAPITTHRQDQTCRIMYVSMHQLIEF
jgi:hypothetical protein